MELRKILAEEIAKGIIVTGVEGAYDSVAKSTSYDYPSIGVSQWEGSRADNLLTWIDGGDKFIGRSYADIVAKGELEELKALLRSEQGKVAQLAILANDCLDYVDALQQIPEFDDTRCLIYAGIWCPTSTWVVTQFLKNRAYRYDLRNLEVMRDIFKDEYWMAAAVDRMYYFGYSNRAENTYEYVNNLDLSTLWARL